MYREPKAAKRLYFDVIPRHVDEYYQFLDAYERQAAARAAVESGLAHSFRRAAQDRQSGAVRDAAVARHRLECGECRHAVGLHRPLSARRHPRSHPHLAKLVDYAIHYFRDFVLPAKKFREPSDAERAALIDLRDALSQLRPDADAQDNPRCGL